MGRRTAISASAGALVALTGCDPEGAPAPTRSTGAAPTAPAEDPDAALVDEAVAAIRDALDHVRRGPRPALLPQLARMHRQHLAALDATPGRLGKGSAAPRGIDVWRSEVRLQQHLARLAGRAQSGTLARLLASMSAGIAAQLAAGRPKGVRY